MGTLTRKDINAMNQKIREYGVALALDGAGEEIVELFSALTDAIRVYAEQKKVGKLNSEELLSAVRNAGEDGITIPEILKGKGNPNDTRQAWVKLHKLEKYRLVKSIKTEPGKPVIWVAIE